MSQKKWFRGAVIITIIGTVLLGRAKKVTAGKTLFVSKGAKYAFPVIDAEAGKVLGVIHAKGKTYMTVSVDVHADTYKVEGSLKGFERKLHTTDEESIAHICHCAKLLSTME
ncbi:hypothetical protein [Lysinibacillus sp. NPDC047702]|uniref:hypothetical protein n=1 Tax=unclassified Lysinibacillus TaxID=2636778 RepID=UPI003D0347D2